MTELTDIYRKTYEKNVSGSPERTQLLLDCMTMDVPALLRNDPEVSQDDKEGIAAILSMLTRAQDNPQFIRFVTRGGPGSAVALCKVVGDYYQRLLNYLEINDVEPELGPSV